MLVDPGGRVQVSRSRQPGGVPRAQVTRRGVGKVDGCFGLVTGEGGGRCAASEV